MSRAGSADPWLHQAREDLMPDRPLDRPVFSGTMYGREPATAPLDFMIGRAYLDDAACADKAGLFERSAGVTSRARAVAGARAVCASCLVRKACLDDAMESESGDAMFRWGIRGGMTERERADVWLEQQAT